MIQTTRRQLVTTKLCWESRFGIPLLGESRLLPWCVRHSAYGVARFMAKVSGRTAFEDVHDTAFRQELVPWGETVLFRMPNNKLNKQPKDRFRVAARLVGWQG